MSEYLPVRSSHVLLLKDVSLFHQPTDGEFVLYKREGSVLDQFWAKDPGLPDLFIRAGDRDSALEEMTASMNGGIRESIAAGGLNQVKDTLCRIVDEALTPGQEKVMDALPETIEILLDAYEEDRRALDYLTRIAAKSRVMVEHSVNVTALVLQFCLFHGMDRSRTKWMGLGALIHDVGTVEIDKAIIEKKERLTEKEFKIYSGHTLFGHEIIVQTTNFNELVSRIALEHHERIDGSGYPHQTRDIAYESQVIGLIDSYESLTYWTKEFRKRKKPFDSLSLIKDETLGGKFSKKIFKQFTSCLIR
ncbi:HD-GYP domain-containing protein [Desulfospira joergensenii]|uniref:HD-GYP domain-containing protein n=1 Tax=Desulfospira joergensenii TaxID=53329 RepID=UPI0003B3EE13|nr:HD domain-containing phosphohydrolase [Desulfospira joergensenii]